MSEQTLISIHDVMPETLGAVAGILENLEYNGVAKKVTLLVVPGRDWSDDGIATLRRWAGDGHELAGHGWMHEAATIQGLRHRLHSSLISRNVAEHLALDANGICALVEDCHAWFARQALPAPSLYVPPAWAMGPIDRRSLRALPFRYYETLTGLYDARDDRFAPLPLLGFEADTPGRAVSLKVLNAVNGWIGRCCGRLRLAIHPRDFQLFLASDLERRLRSVTINATAN